MSVKFPGFIDASYQLSNHYAAIERTVNSYLIANEAHRSETKFDFITNPFPANQPFSAVPVPSPFNQPNRGLLELRGRVYGVNGGVVFEILEDGSMVNVGSVAVDENPASVVANGNGQIFIASAGNGYVIPNGGGAGSLLTGFSGFLGASYAAFQDGYILVVTPNSNQFQISGNDDNPVGDATLWSTANVSVQAGQADKLRAILSSREYVRLAGARRSQVYQNVGNLGIGQFPFQSFNQTFIETGIAAPFSLSDMGDSLIWIGQDSRGIRACWRDAGFNPQRISTFAIENWWQSYVDISDAVAFPFIWMGHAFYQVTFPSAGIGPGGAKIAATWVYDATVSSLVGRPVWSERSYMAPNGGLKSAIGIAPGRPEMFHCFGFGRHLVGSTGADGNPGAIYQYSSSKYADCGKHPTSGAQIQQPIVCDRIAPHLYDVDQNVIYNRITLELARGVGNPVEPGLDPQMLLRWSNDGGNTFGAEYALPLGKQGQYVKRVYLNRLGYAQRGGGGRVFWSRMADPVFNSMIGAQLDFVACAP